jgi:carbamoyltransferase
MTAILGISAFYHDSAAALVVDGEIMSAVQEERFSREKYDPRFPAQAVRYCLENARIAPEELDYVAFYEQPLTKFERLFETYVSYAPAGFASFRQAIPVWLRQKLHMPREIRRGLNSGYAGRIFFPSHHESHAASAFFPSPFDEAAIVTLDGVGEWSTTAIGFGRDNKLELLREIRFPHSLGLLYSAFTYYCGFKVNSAEYKLMGLAPYGEPRYAELIKEKLINVKDDGSYALDSSYFTYSQGLRMTGAKFAKLFGGPPRQPNGRLEPRHRDLAASVQRVTEEVVQKTAHHAWERTGRPRNLVMAGGVALNCVANGRLLREGPFDNVWIQPASGDAGGAVGAALFAWHQILGKRRRVVQPDGQKASLLGPCYSSSAVRQVLDGLGARYHHYHDEAELLEQVAGLIDEGRIVGWFHGRAEYGPRALGARSIIGDARSPRMQSDLNQKIKFRESFRPFAPCVLREHVHEWFQMREREESPYMLLVAPVLARHRVALDEQARTIQCGDSDLARRVNVVRSSVPAITHVDFSARVQTVDERHGRFHRLLKAFYARTGCPVLVNTSFNLSWEPIVLTPEQAYHTFMQSEMDALVIEDCVLHKAEQPLGMMTGAVPAEVAATPDPESPWADPFTGEPLVMTDQDAYGAVTGRRYPILDGIPRLFALTENGNDRRDVTEIVKQFYEETPFPNYDDLDNPRALLEKAREGMFARLLNEQIPYGARVVEIGCGTGQLTNYLAIAHRTVLGVDVCLNSLRLAERFKSEHGIERATFAQMNLFRPALKDGFFDFVISNGVLHHTADCRRAFARISRLAKPGGYVIVGLYNAFSRRIHHARVGLYRLTGLTSRLLDPHFARVGGNGKREAWFRDQYCHPHETCHTLDEVMRWMAEDGLEFVNSIPKPEAGPGLTPDERMFARNDPGTAFGRVVSQLAYMGSGYREGGFFIVIGRRRIEGQSAQ